MSQQYDIIGDIHGYYDELVSLLEKLGYQKRDGCWQHTERQALFIGDYIDRGPGQRNVIELIRTMVEKGSAQAIMGNHEFNAIAFYTKDVDGTYLRPRSNHNITQHKEFLNEVAKKEEGVDIWAEVIDWFKTLPLWLDLDGIRLIHACWDQPLIDRILKEYGTNKLTDQFLARAAKKGTWEYEAIETLLKGKEVDLPNGISFEDKEGIVRHNMRVKWWDSTANTYSKAYMGPEIPEGTIPNDLIESSEAWVSYLSEEKPVFIGHYWLSDDPKPLASNIACTDYSVARVGGKLVAYRWFGEAKLNQRNYLSVSRMT